MHGTHDGRGAARRAAPAVALLGTARAALVALGAALALATGPAPAARAAAQVPSAPSRLSVDVWINKEEGGVFASGEKMQVFFRTSEDAYVILYNIDTEGYVHLIYPFRPSDPMRVQGGETFRVPSRHDPYDLVAEGPEGVEYVVAVASPLPFGELPWFLAPGYGEDDRGREADSESDDPLDRGVIVGDPYVGMQRLNERIVPDGREEQVATADTYFYIDHRVEYPRYVCADCHHRTYWFDPYVDACSVFEIRIDATWARYGRPWYSTARPRYYYYVRPSAPPRYREYRERWSSLDGPKQLRERFVVQKAPPPQRVRAESPRRQQPPEFKDLRRYRPGRFWEGRGDQVIKVKERRDRAPDRGQVQGRGGNGGRERGEPQTQSPPPNRRDAERREKPAPPPSNAERDRSNDRKSEPSGKSQERQPPPPEKNRSEERQRSEPKSQPPAKGQDRNDEKPQSQGQESRYRGR